LSVAFQEAHVPADRRRSHRIKQHIAAELTEWDKDRPGRTFGVMIEDFSTQGVGLIHSGPLKVGHQYTLEIPRPGHPPIKVVLKVVRCDQVHGGEFTTRLEASEILAGRKSKAGARLLLAPAAICGALAFAGALAFYLGFFD
jgi:hypothetical protein